MHVDDLLARDWFYTFELPDGRRTEPKVPPDVASIHSARLGMVCRAFASTFGDDWSGVRVLDLACHQGWFAVQLARRGVASVRGVDIRPEHVDDARAMATACEVPTASFDLGDVTKLGGGDLGRHDAVLMLGLLYHLENPIGALRAARAHASRLCLVETQVAPEVGGTIEWGSRRWEKQVQGGFALIDEATELSSRNMEANVTALSLVPTPTALLHAMRAVGFDRVELLRPTAENEQLAHGKRVMAAGWVD